MDTEGVAVFLYTVYGNDAEWKAWNEEPMRPWSELPHDVRRHWLAVAAAAEGVGRRRK